MVPRIFPTAADWLATLLRRWVRKGYALNVTLAEDGIELAVGLEDGERVVALVQTADGRAIVLTSERVVEHGRTVLRYGEVVRCYWITDKLRPRDLRRLKQTHFDRLILELENGAKVVLVGLGQAVFPMQRQGRRPLNRCASEDFQQVVFVPTTATAFHGDARAVGMLLQE